MRVTWTSLVAQTVKHLPTMWETWVQYLGWEDLLEKEMAPHSSTGSWKSPWTEEPGRWHSVGSQGLRQDWATFTFTFMASLVAQTVKHLSTMRETWVWSLDWEDPLEKEMAVHSSTITWKIPWTEEPPGLQSMGVAKSQTRLSDFTFTRPFRTNTPKRCPFHYRGLEWKVGSQETPGVTGKFGLGVHNEARQKTIEFCQENALIIANNLFQQHKRRLYTWTSPDSQHQNQIDWLYSLYAKFYTVS